jgi:hypothetical protein
VLLDIRSNSISLYDFNMRMELSNNKMKCLFVLLLISSVLYIWLFVLLKQRWTNVVDIHRDHANRTKLIEFPLSIQRQERGQSSPLPFVTMFTTIRDRECRKTIHSRTIIRGLVQRDQIIGKFAYYTPLGIIYLY